VAGDRLFWAFHNADLVACATTGCSELQRVSSAWGASCLATDGDALYWVDRDKTLQRLDLKTDAAGRVRELTDQVAQPDRLAVNGDYLYVTDVEAALPNIQRVRKDGTRGAELVIEDDAISGLSAVGDSIYYPSRILSGRIVKCAPADCASGAVTLAYNQRWPSEIRVDGDEAFWLTDTRFSYQPANSTLSSCRLPDCASVQSRVADFPLNSIADYASRDASFAVDPQSIVWLEARNEHYGSSLRSLAR
jgi:hypothetical protein